MTSAAVIDEFPPPPSWYVSDETEQAYPDNNCEISVSSISYQLQYRCEWKEIGLFENTRRQCFGLTVIYVVEQHIFLIRFDGDDGSWQYYDLEGPHGRVERHDLVIGARIKLLGRTITVTRMTSQAVRWIDSEAHKLSRRQDLLLDKISSAGQIPVVKRPHWEPSFDINRQHKGTNGRVDLRILLIENGKLFAQLDALGLLGDSFSESLHSASPDSNSRGSMTQTLRNAK